MTPPSTATPSEIAGLVRCSAVFLPADPPRTGTVAFWHPDGPPAASAGRAGSLTVVVREGSGTADRTVPALLLPVREALPVLTRARAAAAHPAAAYWGSVAVLALQLTARGRLLPGLTATDHDAWRAGPLTPEDRRRVTALAAAMPPEARAVPLPGTDPVLLPEAEPLVRAFLDAVADGLPRTPAAALAAGGPAFAAPEPRRMPEHRSWAAEIAAGHDAGVKLSLRIEVTGPAGPADDDTAAAPGLRAVLQVHSLADPSLVADAAAVWTGADPVLRLSPRARMDALLTLRRAARAWPALEPLLSAAVPDAVDLADEEVTELLGPATAALEAAGVRVHWPRALARPLTARAVVGADGDGPADRPGSGPSLLSADALLRFDWRFALGDQRLTAADLDRLAEAARPVVRLRDQWVVIDPEAVRRARDRSRTEHRISPVEALGVALTGRAETPDGPVEVEVTGRLAALRDRIARPEDTDRRPVAQPAALAATLRDYQLRGLDWLDRMTSLGLGGCLADDMGLGKTITLIALHLHRQTLPEAAGPTLVVCPASLLGNWQREIERFAPGTPVRRYHGPGRSLSGLADGAFVLTTYGTMRLDAARLAGAGPWGLLVADEAQHVKNPFSATAKELRTIGAKARVALSGTPVENNLTELWAILDWTTPGLLGTLGAFRRRYAQHIEGGAGDPAVARRLTSLVAPFLLRRRKSDPGIAPELPPKTETDRAVALTAEQATLYEAVVRESLAEISGADAMARRGLIVKLLTSLKQICNHPAQYLKEDRPRITGRSGKLELLDELLDTLLAEDAGTLVFTQYVRMAEILRQHLADRGVPTLFLHGGTPVARRDAMVRSFQEGEAPVFLLSLKAAGTGLNLTRAEHVVHYDRWWNPAVEDQATDRAYRIGQTRPVQVHRLIAEGTVEDRIAALLERKRELADAVLGAGEAALTELSDAELAELVQLTGSVR
ncbi:DEAD/DEAH box helicase [Streptomyces pactum]|uniref:DEAD/DEAH box helicase n=1 Tax=Streptomyces pactum TaxID=68249 RepID=A0ABS0NEB3_9ACTN|nr:DEAD/DEAH box helicase [Streptomyces pactum]MBH5333530.1 DEAD/DEAH box helicase [Streptomyces pactum]MBH5338815.1 DEAD/DEAH box helicase [Streptomyces pactum]